MAYSWHGDGPNTFQGPAKGDYRGTLMGNADQQPTSFSATEAMDPMADKVRQLGTFFGSPSDDAMAAQKERMREPGYWEQESSDFPEAFSNYFGSNSGGGGGMRRNNHIATILIEKTKASENWQLSYMAPWKESNGLTFSWSQIKFNQHMLDREPEQSVPRLLTSTKTGGSAGMVRYGIALLLEATFASTPQGVQTYLLNLEQIRIATVETCSYGVMVSIMTHQTYKDPYKRAGHAKADTRDKTDIDRILRDECRMWALVHKEKNGYETISRRMTTILESRGVHDADFTVLPAGMGQHLKDLNDNKYYLTGRHASSNVTRDLANFADRASGKIIVESRGFNQGEGSEPHDPCFRDQTTGDFMTLDDSSIQNCTAEEYHTYMLDTLGFNVDENSWFHFRYTDLYQKAGVWDFTKHTSPLTEEIGRFWGHDSRFYTHGQMAYAWSNNYERLLKCLVNLTPAKQREMRATLRLIESNDFKAKYNLSGGKVFEKRLFDAMFDNSGACKYEMSKVYSVGDHEGFKRAADSSLYDEAYEDFKRAKGVAYRKSIAVSADAYKKLASVEDEEMKDEYEMVDVPNLSLQPDTFMRKIVSVKRKVVPESQLGVTGGELDPAVRAVEAIAAEILAVVGVTVTHEGAAKTIDLLLKEAATNQLKRDVCGWVRRLLVLKSVHAIACLSEFKRVMVNELVKLNPRQTAAENAKAITTTPQVKKFSRSLVIGFVPFLGLIQTRLALDEIRLEQTATERLMQKESRDLADVPVDVAKEGWWNPVSADNAPFEDGQIRLLVAPNGPTQSLPIPHDTYATTLAANHSVLFAITPDQLKFMTGTDGKWSCVVGEGAKMGRTDALVWSAYLSAMLAQRPANAEALKTNFAATSPDVMRRLKRVALKIDEKPNILECQQHLSKLITALHVCLIGLANEKQDTVAQLQTKLNTASTELADAVFPADDGDTFLDQLDNVIQRGYIIERAAPAAGAAVPAGAAAPAIRIDAGAAPVVWTRDVVHDLLQRASLASGEFIRFCVDNDIPLALYARIWRPHKTTRMGSMIRMKAGKDGAATTFYKKPDFMMADNAAQKTIYGHYTMYNKTQVLHNEMIVLMHNVYCSGYVGGWGVSVWDPLNDNHKYEYIDSRLEHDCFVTLGPMYHTTSSDHVTSWRSLTGVVPDSLNAREEVQDMMKYPGCKAYTNFWKWQTNAKLYGQGTDADYKIASDDTERKQNVLCFQAAQWKWDMRAGDYKKIVRDQGHWGSDIDEGMRDVLDGTKPMIQKAFYNGGRQTELV